MMACPGRLPCLGCKSIRDINSLLGCIQRTLPMAHVGGSKIRDPHSFYQVLMWVLCTSLLPGKGFLHTFPKGTKYVTIVYVGFPE